MGVNGVAVIRRAERPQVNTATKRTETEWRGGGGIYICKHAHALRGNIGLSQCLCRNPWIVLTILSVRIIDERSGRFLSLILLSCAAVRVIQAMYGCACVLVCVFKTVHSFKSSVLSSS